MPNFCQTLLDILKHRIIGAALAFMTALLRGLYQKKSFYCSLLDALMCALFGSVAHELLLFLGMKTDYTWLISIVIGYLGTDYIGSWLKKKLG
ncbi:Putative phage holin, lambda family [Bacteriophage APSE-2]|uniref:Phage holin, lambda family n=1 Tax=Bacteriophage APSE-2 TaxID=340054 RepID=A0A6F9EWT9_9CAUD|nr:Putative phage holin, lambda family [Bacteriophage APSE-2]